MKMGILAATVAVAGLSSSALAGTVLINSSNVQLGTQTTVGGAKYKLSTGNWDQAVWAGSGGTTSSFNGTTGNFISNNLGGAGELNNVVMSFSLSYAAGDGFTFEMNNGTTTYSLRWADSVGSYANSGTSESTSILNGVSATANSFNLIEIFVRSTTNGAGTYMNATDLQFTAASQTVIGALHDSEQGPNSSETQYIASTTDLSTFDWTLTGNFQGNGASSGGAEGIKVEIGFKNNNFTIIPLPTPVTMAGAGLLMLAGVRRRYN